MAKKQQRICEKFESEYLPCDPDEKLGIAIETIGQLPINGLRHMPERGTCGWYIWCGEDFSEDTEFFQPLHVKHIDRYLPEIEKFLGLAPGFRFLIAGEYEDVWCDSKLRNV